MYLKKHPKAKHLPLVYPIIIYNGKAKYQVPRQFWDLFELSQRAKEIWTQNHPVIDVNEIQDEEFVNMGWIGALEFFLKHWHEKDFMPVLEKAKKIDILPGLLQSEEGIAYFETLLHYLLTGIDKNDKVDLDKVISSSINKELGEKFMPKFATSLAKHWIDEGKVEGRMEGRMEGKMEGRMETAKNMLEHGSDIKFIATVTGLDIAQIQRLKTSLG
jgi:predicted transposase/invertase (TIGR01784 family)